MAHPPQYSQQISDGLADLLAVDPQRSNEVISEQGSISCAMSRLAERFGGNGEDLLS